MLPERQISVLRQMTAPSANSPLFFYMSNVWFCAVCDMPQEPGSKHRLMLTLGLVPDIRIHDSKQMSAAQMNQTLNLRN